MNCYRCKTWPCECPDGITLIHGDCREVLPQLGKFDLVLTDPPYGIADSPIPTQGRTGKRTGSVNRWHPPSEWDFEFPLYGGPLVVGASDVVFWFGHWRQREAACEAIDIPLRAEIIWAKDTHVGPPCPAAMQDERLWVFSRNGLKPRCFETTVWHEPIIPTWAHRHHKNQKPVALMKRALRWLPGETVLDPFCGSGTTLVAAKLLGRKATGIEIEEKYCEITAQRLRQGVLEFAD